MTGSAATARVGTSGSGTAPAGGGAPTKRAARAPMTYLNFSMASFSFRNERSLPAILRGLSNRSLGPGRTRSLQIANGDGSPVRTRFFRPRPAIRTGSPLRRRRKATGDHSQKSDWRSSRGREHPAPLKNETRMSFGLRAGQGPRGQDEKKP